MLTYWIEYHGRPIHCVRLPEGANEHDVKREALDELDVVPGVVCARGELPPEHRAKIHYGTVTT